MMKYEKPEVEQVLFSGVGAVLTMSDPFTEEGIETPIN